jgi:hypothetical protein
MGRRYGGVVRVLGVGALVGAACWFAPVPMAGASTVTATATCVDTEGGVASAPRTVELQLSLQAPEQAVSGGSVTFGFSVTGLDAPRADDAGAQVWAEVDVEGLSRVTPTHPVTPHVSLPRRDGGFEVLVSDAEPLSPVDLGTATATLTAAPGTDAVVTAGAVVVLSLATDVLSTECTFDDQVVLAVVRSIAPPTTPPTAPPSTTEPGVACPATGTVVDARCAPVDPAQPAPAVSGAPAFTG